ncbi:MAG: twin-arginine translocation signal domain-containing protein, partial [Verrucomicrobiia bacterium]
MSKNPIGRRDFLGTAALGAVGIVLGRPLSTFAAAPSALKIEEPFHGAVLNHRHGKVVDRGLAIRVSGKAPEGDRVLVGDKEAEREGERFTAEVVLRDRETNITVTSKGSSGRHEDRVRVV